MASLVNRTHTVREEHHKLENHRENYDLAAEQEVGSPKKGWLVGRQGGAERECSPEKGCLFRKSLGSSKEDVEDEVLKITLRHWLHR